jgi:hypothetical protein
MGEMDRALPGVPIPGAERVIAPTERDCGEPCTRSHGMDGIREFLSAARDHGLAATHFRGLLHVAIGRKITRPDGSTVSAGVTWRVLAQELKNLRFDQEFVRQLGLDPGTLAARDRERFWYAAIGQTRVDSPESVIAGEELVPKLKPLGFVVGPPPASLLPPPPPKPKPTEPKSPPPKAKEKEKDTRGHKKKR